MVAPPNIEEVKSTYRPPRFNDQYYGWWKTRMHDFIMAKDSELWDIICDGPFVPTKTIGAPAVTVPKTRKEYNDADRKAIEKNFRFKKILVCGIGPDEYNMISACQSAKEIWEALQTAHEGQHRMKDDESIQDMHTRFTSIITELHSLGEIIPKNKLVRKILSVLPGSWESKVNAITEAKDLQELTIDELVGNLKTYKMKKKKDNERIEPKREKKLVLKTDNNDSGGEDADMAYLTKRFKKWFAEMEAFQKGAAPASQKVMTYVISATSQDTSSRIALFSIKIKKNVADNAVKQALAAWGDSSSESEEDDQGDSSMMAVESEAAEYDSIFALMAKPDNDKDDDDDDEVNFLDVQRNLKSYSPKKLMSLANILIDAYHSLINDKDALTVELGKAKQSRDDLVVVVVDLKETIESQKKEKDALTEKITNIEHDRDDLVVVVVDLKETIEFAKKEKEVLAEGVANIEHERDDLLVVVVDLKEIIEELKRESRPGHTRKGKEVVSEALLRFEDELKLVKSSLCAELEKNRQLQEDLGTVKSNLEKSLKWTWSSDAITAIFLSVSQICDKGNKVEFVSKICTVTNFVTGEVVRLDHVSFTLLNKLVKKDLVHGLPKSRFKDHRVCDACIKGKQVRSSFKLKKEVSTLRPLDLLHMDLYGPMRVPSRGGKKSIFVILDDYSRFIWTLFLRTKDETFQVYVEFVKKIQVKTSHNVVYISGIAKGFWAKAVNTACYLVNSNGKETLRKFDAKSDEGIFLGYSSQSKAYKVYNKRTQCVEESIHVIFNESHDPCGKYLNDKNDQDGEQSIVPSEVIDMANGKTDMMSHVEESNEDGATISPIDEDEPGPSITTIEAENRVVDAVQGTPHAKIRRSQACLSQIDPKNIKEALKDVDWITAMQEELHQFERNSGWHLVLRPVDRTVIGTRFVFRNKLDEVGNTTRNNARLVVQGYNQEEGIDYERLLQLLE
ncbi:PREDICTED: uncharacterized protein LOC109233861 [Nicotiana attenuata]|uniref:uncharacterized protein LOC109233861 n=1 Tax=Nicotiana attenuata TaxID=49451 RepID=UPI0009055793|nr:PREDICTED: uncharacterized protein LOC109233861 [Nicotiana attenuata]